MLPSKTRIHHFSLTKKDLLDSLDVEQETTMKTKEPQKRNIYLYEIIAFDSEVDLLGRLDFGLTFNEESVETLTTDLSCVSDFSSLPMPPMPRQIKSNRFGSWAGFGLGLGLLLMAKFQVSKGDSFKPPILQATAFVNSASLFASKTYHDARREASTALSAGTQASTLDQGRLTQQQKLATTAAGLQQKRHAEHRRAQTGAMAMLSGGRSVLLARAQSHDSVVSIIRPHAGVEVEFLRTRLSSNETVEVYKTIYNWLVELIGDDQVRGEEFDRLIRIYNELVITQKNLVKELRKLVSKKVNEEKWVAKFAEFTSQFEKLTSARNNLEAFVVNIVNTTKTIQREELLRLMDEQLSVLGNDISHIAAQGRLVGPIPAPGSLNSIEYRSALLLENIFEGGSSLSTQIPHQEKLEAQWNGFVSRIPGSQMDTYAEKLIKDMGPRGFKLFLDITNDYTTMSNDTSIRAITVLEDPEVAKKLVELSEIIEKRIGKNVSFYDITNIFFSTSQQFRTKKEIQIPINAEIYQFIREPQKKDSPNTSLGCHQFFKDELAKLLQTLPDEQSRENVRQLFQEFENSTKVCNIHHILQKQRGGQNLRFNLIALGLGEHGFAHLAEALHRKYEIAKPIFKQSNSIITRGGRSWKSNPSSPGTQSPRSTPPTSP